MSLVFGAGYLNRWNGSLGRSASFIYTCKAKGSGFDSRGLLQS